MTQFPQEPEHQEAHQQKWHDLLKALGGKQPASSEAVIEVLWMMAKDQLADSRGVVVVDCSEPAHKIRVLDEEDLQQIQLEARMQANLNKALQTYDPTCQIIVIAIYAVLDSANFQVDILALEVPDRVRSKG